MISRKQIGDAYRCCHQVARRMIRSAGITHRNSISPAELRQIIKMYGWPLDKSYSELAETAMKSPTQLDMFAGVQQSRI